MRMQQAAPMPDDQSRQIANEGTAAPESRTAHEVTGLKHVRQQTKNEVARLAAYVLPSPGNRL